MKMLLSSNLIVADNNNDIHLIAESEQYGKEIYECSHASSTCSIIYDTTEIEKYGEPTPGDIGSTASSNLAMGQSHSCAIIDDGSVMCWDTMATEH